MGNKNGKDFVNLYLVKTSMNQLSFWSSANKGKKFTETFDINGKAMSVLSILIFVKNVILN